MVCLEISKGSPKAEEISLHLLKTETDLNSHTDEKQIKGWK